MKRISRPAVLAILDSIQKIESAAEGVTLEEYSRDWRLKFAVERAIEILSEASRRLAPELGHQHPEVDWKQVMGIGNVLRHDYDDIVDSIILDAIRKRLPVLKSAIIAIEAGLDEPNE